ncbi:hypothetical protein ILUMI_18142 [Ignelater luminosus]|uniref:Uncharacterized protein n=1 Tax=Ignelater luminosus TaxID=2038154 RepID=A0A8K0G6U8_IGNLU|nr:hypothetical protein ILUMI_18142 [Ignelater luminosus]
MLDEAMQTEILGQFAATPTLSFCKASAVMGICQNQYRKCLNFNKFVPYKMQIVQELTKDDYDRQIQWNPHKLNFCNSNFFSSRNLLHLLALQYQLHVIFHNSYFL